MALSPFCVWGEGGGWQGVSLAGFLGLEPIVTELCELKAFVTWGGGLHSHFGDASIAGEDAGC